MSKTPITPAELVTGLVNKLDGAEPVIAGQETTVEFVKAYTAGTRPELELTVTDEAGYQHRFRLTAQAVTE